MTAPAVTAASPLTTSFATLPLDPRLSWTVTRPPAATPSSAGLRIVPFAGADLWERTGPAAGKSAIDGAALTARVEGERFAAATALTLHAKHDWDQGGLFLRSPADDGWWAKACVEAVPGGGRVLAVSVTRGGWTDQSTAPLPPAGLAPPAEGGGGPVSVALRVVREGASLGFYWADPAAADGGGGATTPSPHQWTRLRLAPLAAGDGAPPPPSLDVGVYALAPAAAGCVAVFRSLSVRVVEGGADGGRLGLCGDP
jgi:regulation of enolase protein 1 (concanavalin A-like superfamily)